MGKSTNHLTGFRKPPRESTRLGRHHCALGTLPDLCADLATVGGNQKPVNKQLGRRHSITLTKPLPTTHLCLGLLALLTFLFFPLPTYTIQLTQPIVLSPYHPIEQMENPNAASGNNPPKDSHSLLPEDEAGAVKVIRSRQDVPGGSLDKRVLVGRIIALKPPNKAGMKNSIRKLWQEYDLLQISESNSKIFMFTFKTATQASKVYSEGPWFVLGNLLSVQEMIAGKPVTEVKYNSVPFWLQVHGLPLGFLNIDSVKAIMDRVGIVSAIELPVIEGRVLRSFTRVRIAVDVYKPLWAGSWISLEDESSFWVVFKYENLQGLCFNSGHLGHEQRSCTNQKVMAPFDKLKPKFGLFLCAETPRPLTLIASEGSGQRQNPSPNLSPSKSQASPQKLSVVKANTSDVVDEGQGSNDTERGNLQRAASRNREVSRQLSFEVRKDGNRLGKEVVGDNLDEENWQDSSEGGQPMMNLIDLTSDTDMEMTQSLVDKENLVQAQNWSLVDYYSTSPGGKKDRGKAPQLTFQPREKGGPSNPNTQLANLPNSDTLEKGYMISLPEEDLPRGTQEIMKKLDQVTEQELIQTWNSRFHLKRGRAGFNELEEIEDELVRRKKFKRESWYDAEGNVLCVAITSEFGNQTYILDEEGFPKPQSS